jgi:starvation-inducible DNA-binding protein
MALRRHDPKRLREVAREISTDNSAKNPLVTHLCRQVANAFVIYTNYKHYHWQTYGPLFRDLHLMFDEFARDVLESIDMLAERVRMIGPDPPDHLMKMSELASVSAAVEAHTTMQDMIEEGQANALIAIKELRQGAKMADAHGDPGTVDLCSKLVQIYEKQEWWLRDILRKRDGFCS